MSPKSKTQIISLLMSMDMTFGRSRATNKLLPSVFSMYGPFDDLADPIFPVKCPLLVYACI